MRPTTMASPYHVRLAVSQYGEQFRAELFTEDLGDTEGDLLVELPPSIAEWVPYLAQGADLPPDAARQLGKDLFSVLLGQPENAKKWAEVLTQAARGQRPIRLLIDATTESVRDLPYGLLCEPHDDWFLFRGGVRSSVAFVRILRRCSPRPLKLPERLRLLIVAAEPRSADVPPFEAAVRLRKLVAALHTEIDLFLCEPDGPRSVTAITPNPESADPAVFLPYTRATRDSVRRALAGEFEIFHLLAHGHGAGVLLCDAGGGPAEATASELGEWCGLGRASLAFLQVCKAGQTANRGGFGGVAQQLLNPRGGNLAAVVASTFPLDAEHSTQAAIDFYRQLAAGKPPEEALAADRPETDLSWAFLELWARPGALGGTQERATFQFVSPYRGLSSFGEQEADLFFGRTSEVAELLQVLRADPAVAVVGDSGSGKTSLLHAGLVHAVRCHGLAGSDSWRIVTLRPGYRPAQTLALALTGASGEPTLETLRAALRAGRQPLMVVFDQFEEVFTLARDKAEVQLVIDALTEAVEQQRDRFRLVIGMRSEFLGQAAAVPQLNRLIHRPWVLRPPDADDLRDIVAGPAEHCGYTFQAACNDGNPAHAVSLLERILADPLLARDACGATSAPLPLLQFALERLWLKAVEKGVTEFTHAEFDEIGGMGKAIAQHAESVFQASGTATAAGPAGRGLAEQIITSLVSAQGTRQPRVRDSLQAETGNPEAARAVVDYLVGERLLTVRSDPEDMTKSLVDLSHEALIQNWERLRGWLAEDPQGRAMREEFRRATEQWEHGFAGVQPRSWFALPQPDVARNYLAWIDTSKPRLSASTEPFVAAMRQMLVRQRRRRRILVSSLAGLAIASSLLAIYARIQAGYARTNAATATQNASDARASERTARERAATLSLENGIRISEQGWPRIGILSIAKSLELCPSEATALRRVIRTNLAAWAPKLMRLEAALQLGAPAMAASPQGEVALLQTGSDSLRLVEMATGRPVGPPIPVANTTGMWAQVIGVDAEWLVLVYNAKTLQLWNGSTGQPVGPVIDPRVPVGAGAKVEGDIYVAALSPDGQTVAAAMTQGDVWIWNARTGTREGTPLDHDGRVNCLTFTPDGKLLLTGCSRVPASKSLADDVASSVPEALKTDIEQHAAGAARLWELATRKVVHLDFQLDPVTFVAVSPDAAGRFFAFGGSRITVWDRQEDQAVGPPLNDPEPGLWGTFDPSYPGRLLIVRPSGLLDIVPPVRSDERREFIGERLSPQGWTAGVGFRPQDNTIFTLNEDGAARFWSNPTQPRAEQEYLHPDAVLSVAFGPESQSFVAGCRDGSIYLWAVADTTKYQRRFDSPLFPGLDHRQPIIEVQVGRDGTRLMARDLASRVFIWDLVTGDPIEPADGETFSGAADDGVTVLVRLADQMYCVRDLRTGSSGKPFVIAGGLGHVPEDSKDDTELLRVIPVAFSSDRSHVAMINASGQVELRQTNDGKLVASPITHAIEGRPDSIRSVAFSPTGNRLLTQSKHARGLWVSTTGAADDFLTNTVGVQLSRFSHTGDAVISATNFNRAQIWDVAKRKTQAAALLHANRLWGIATESSGTRVATASSDRTAVIWDLATGLPLSPSLNHTEGVSDLRFSHDQKWLLTGSWDRRARRWSTVEPVADQAERVQVWVETMTGLRIGETGASDLLTVEEWQARKQRLGELGGPP